MGDMLQSMYVALSLAIVTKSTLVVPDNWGTYSFHMMKNFKSRSLKVGYQGVFYDVLGLPRLTKVTEIRDYKRFIWRSGAFDQYFYRPELFAANAPCRSFTTIETRSCGPKRDEYCVFKHGHVVYETVHPLLRDARMHSNDHCRSASLRSLGLAEDRVNIVWHLRTGDICLKCDTMDYFQRIHSFLAAATNGTAYQNILVFQHPDQIKSQLILAAIPRSVAYTSAVIEDVVCLFLRTDVLISTGSSFPQAISVFSEPFRPIYLTEMAKEYMTALDYEPVNPSGFWSPYHLNQPTAVKLSNGSVQYYHPQDIRQMLRLTGALDRIKNARLLNGKALNATVSLAQSRNATNSNSNSSHSSSSRSNNSSSASSGIRISNSTHA
jgi:hypothetical protein